MAIALEIASTQYTPQNTLHGQVTSAETVTLTLRWRVEGRCDPSMEVIDVLEYPAGTHDFSFALPAEPLSYDGLLFRYLWEIVATNSINETVQSFRVGENIIPDPYHQVGLKYNPFIVDDIARQENSLLDYQHTWQGVDDNLWLERGYSQAPEANNKQLVQLLGVKGAGKSSHLKHWQKQTGGRYRYYPPSWQRFAFPPLEPICYWDEADRIPKPLLYMAFFIAAQKGYTICAGTHVDLKTPATLLGLHVTTIHLESISAEDIRQWVAMRLKRAERAGGHQLEFTQEQFEDIANKGQGSWRTIAKDLHVWVAKEIIKKIM